MKEVIEYRGFLGRFWQVGLLKKKTVEMYIPQTVCHDPVESFLRQNSYKYVKLGNDWNEQRFISKTRKMWF